jgi:hypothetical protein
MQTETFVKNSLPNPAKIFMNFWILNMIYIWFNSNPIVARLFPGHSMKIFISPSSRNKQAKPPSMSDQNIVSIPFVRFPHWYFFSQCYRVYTHLPPQNGKPVFRATHLVTMRTNFGATLHSKGCVAITRALMKLDGTPRNLDASRIFLNYYYFIIFFILFNWGVFFIFQRVILLSLTSVVENINYIAVKFS